MPGKKPIFFLSLCQQMFLSRLAQHFNVSYIRADLLLSSPLMCWYFITSFLVWNRSCLFPDKPDFCLFIALIPPFTYLRCGRECPPHYRQMAARDVTSRIQTITHFQRLCTGCVFLLSPPHAILSDSAPLLTVGMRDKRSPSRMGPNESFIWHVLRRRCVAVLPLPQTHTTRLLAFAFGLVSARTCWGCTKWTQHWVWNLFNA